MIPNHLSHQSYHFHKRQAFPFISSYHPKTRLCELSGPSKIDPLPFYEGILTRVRAKESSLEFFLKILMIDFLFIISFFLFHPMSGNSKYIRPNSDGNQRV